MRVCVWVCGCNMGVYSVQALPSNHMLALIVAHGVTDFDQPTFPVHYLTWWLLPLPDVAVTAAFAAASIVHFADDLGDTGSLLFHFALLAVGLTRGAQVAFRIVITYLAYFHVPMHYGRAARRGRKRALAAAALSTLALWRVLDTFVHPPTLVLDHLAQRSVIAHVVCEMYAKNA